LKEARWYGPWIWRRCSNDGAKKTHTHPSHAVCRYFGKGSLIAVEGQLQSRTYQAKDGSNRYVVEVVADNVSFTGERRDNSNSGYSNQGYNQGYQNQNYGGNQSYGNQSYGGSQVYQEPAQQTSYQSGSNADFQDMPLDDDLPF
jgi:single-strand DNA-binding protein